MLRRLILAALIAPVIMGLSSCGGHREAEKSSKDVQKFYGALTSVSSEYKVVTDYNSRVSEFTIQYALIAGGAPVMTVVSPEEISGIRAEIGEDKLSLTYDGASLAVEMPEIGGFTPLEALPGLLLTISGDAPTEICGEKIDGVSCAALTYESKDDNRVISKRVWFDQNTLYPVKAELSLDGKTVIYMEFLTFDAA